MEAAATPVKPMTDEELAADFYALICPDCTTVYQWDGVDYHRGCLKPGPIN